MCLGSGDRRIGGRPHCALAGRIALSAGDVAQAETDLQVAQEIFMRLGANLDLRRVEDALKRRANVRIEAIPALVGAQR